MSKLEKYDPEIEAALKAKTDAETWDKIEEELQELDAVTKKKLNRTFNRPKHRRNVTPKKKRNRKRK
jgi:hypothetical protein